MKLYGTKLHIDAHEESTEPQTAKESDFFQEHTSVGITDFVSGAALSNTQRDKDILSDVAEKAGPNVHDGTAPSLSADRPSVIGSRKPRTAKAAGAKKGGLGASKVKTDFAAIESAAENADLQKERQVESANKLAQEQLEKEAERIASLRLAYKEVVEERDKRETALRSVDPKRAEQVERLGMSGANLNTRTGIGHSAFSNVQKIEQEGVTPTSAINANRSSAITSSNMDPYFSSTGFGPSNRILDSYGGSSQSKADDLFGRQPKSSASSWLDEWTVIKSPNEPAARLDDFNDRSSGDRTYFTGSQDNGVTSDWSRSAPSKPRPDPISSRQEASSEQSEALRTKFANATAISSDTYFGRTEPGDLDISRFQGSSSISSDDYFGRARPQQSFQISDEMQSIKDGVRQGVTKVATRLSSLASGVVTSLQYTADLLANGLTLTPGRIYSFAQVRCIQTARGITLQRLEISSSGSFASRSPKQINRADRHLSGPLTESKLSKSMISHCTSDVFRFRVISNTPRRCIRNRRFFFHLFRYHHLYARVSRRNSRCAKPSMVLMLTSHDDNSISQTIQWFIAVCHSSVTFRLFITKPGHRST
ncbi:ADP-ribosylation factor GTPase-activating protein 2/3 [Clonorchis sinensis]|uniref:ADP-ribosylation factor GTPase-activating protein 2/3 n=1 Tax=Clonorchis sinensis TaxID=79923 RepID=G7YRI8_CLOSI|nr:ADP-ribosylation factor GTPase-activating protein 2/3 [Clonorchis sinensis]